MLGGHLNWSKALSACLKALSTGSKTLWLALRPLIHCRMFESLYVQLQKTDGRNFSPFYWTSSPIGAAAQKYKHLDQLLASSPRNKNVSVELRKYQNSAGPKQNLLSKTNQANDGFWLAYKCWNLHACLFKFCFHCPVASLL